MKYLDYTGLSYFWSKIKSYIASLLGSKANDSEVVHIAGTETVTGGKTFTANVTIEKSAPQCFFRDTRGVKGTAPANDLWNQAVSVRDNNDVAYGGLEHAFKSNLENRINLIVYPGTSASVSYNAQIAVGYDSNGDWFTYSPTPGVSDASSKIANTNWVRTATGNTALNAATASRLATARSLWGNAFDGSSDVSGGIVVAGYSALKNNSLVKGTAPSSTQYITFNLCDKNGKDFGPNALGQLETRIGSDNIVHTYIRALKNEANSVASCEIACVYDTNNNTAYTRAPTPASSDNSTKIATTNWVAGADCVVHKTGAETIYGSKTFIDPINGWILLRDNNIPANAAPANNISHTILALANAGGAWINEIYTTAFANGNNKTTMRAWNKTSTGAIEWNAMWNEAANTGYCWGNLYKDMVFINPSISRGSVPSGDQWWSAYFAGADGRDVGGLWGVLNTSQRFTTQLRSYRNDGSNAYSQIWLYFDVNGASAAGVTADTFRPQMATFTALGGAGDARWGQIYSTSSTISTSDERQKCDVAEIPDEVLDAWAGCSFYQYRMKDRVSEKGDGARLHTGMIAQRLDERFRSAGEALDRYGLFCHDSWDASEATFDEAGGVVDSAVEAGDEYSIRYEEALCMEAAWQRRENARLKERIADLEERLAALELKIS